MMQCRCHLILLKKCFLKWPQEHATVSDTSFIGHIKTKLFPFRYMVTNAKQHDAQVNQAFSSMLNWTGAASPQMQQDACQQLKIVQDSSIIHC